jgi:serine/threonine protein kinase
MPQCPKCESAISANSRFCSSCGHAVEPGAALATQTVAASTPTPASKSGSGISSSQPASDGRFAPGALLAGRYRIIALLGRGGMGEVYRADDLTLGQQVALKFLPASLAGNPDSIARFRNEVRVARQVSHPNVCRVYDLGEIDGHFFLSMEYVDGEDLASLLRRIGRLPPDKALEIARKLCASLAAAHEKGVLHRDLKPGNVMLDGRGQVLLTDFGLASLTDEIAGRDVASGTPAYMAPEQLAGKEVTVRSDIYALGLVLYEIFTGKRPFEADTLADLIRARSQTTPVSLSSIVHDLDPVVERVVLRCLDPEPARRPSSALAVAAALPGGDPLAAALAAGETPSPEMVAAAGEGAGLAPAIAIPIFLAILATLVFNCVLVNRSSVLEQIRPEFTPEVLSQKARDLIQRLGYTDRPADTSYGFDWNRAYTGKVLADDKPHPPWRQVLSHPPSPLQFWYRESPYPLTGSYFHDDLLTPGIASKGDPPLDLSGMINLELDSQGRLLYFETIPPQLLEPAKNVPAVDWKPLFSAAGLDPTQFQQAEPLWTFIAASDTRAAWTGKMPGALNDLRVEAAALRGRPVVFSLIGPWTAPDRMPPRESSVREHVLVAISSLIVIVVLVGAALLARRNLRQGRGDRRGALRLATALFAIHMALWIARSHVTASIGTFGMLIVAIATSVFYAVLIWTIYLALEPFVRRRWPQTIVGWTSVLTGRVKDPIVGRDVLIGVALGMSWLLLDRILYLLTDTSPKFGSLAGLMGIRSTLAPLMVAMPHAITQSLIFFFLLFLLRVLLRNSWLGAAACVLLFSSLNASSNDQPLLAGIASFVLYGLGALVVLRFGILALGVGWFVDHFLPGAQVSVNPSAWYFGNTVFILAFVIALATWAFFTSIAGRRLWKQSLFD